MSASPALPLPQALRNERLSQLEIFLIAPYLIVTASYVPVLAARLGASPLLLGALTSLPAIAVALGATLGRAWTTRPGSANAKIIVPALIFRTQLLWIPLLLFLPAWRAEALTLVVVIVSIFAGVANVAFTILMPRLTNRDRLSYLVSSRWTALGIGMAVFTPLLAALLDALAMPVNYIVVCAVTAVFAIVNLVILGKVRYASRPAAPAEQASRRGNVRRVLRHRPALAYILMTFAAYFAQTAAAPLITLRLVRDLGVSNSDFGWYTAITWAAIALVGVLAPRLVAALGTGRLFALSGLVFALHALVLALGASLGWVLLSGAVNGLATVLFQVTAFSLLTDTAPPDNFEGYVPLQSLAINLAIFSAPLVMTAMVSAGVTAQAGLLICVLLRAAFGGVAWLRHGQKPA